MERDERNESRGRGVRGKQRRREKIFPGWFL
jgi:hypothetical protein